MWSRAALISCRQRTSGCSRSTNAATSSSRARMPLTFQVTIFMRRGDLPPMRPAAEADAESPTGARRSWRHRRRHLCHRIRLAGDASAVSRSRCCSRTSWGCRRTRSPASGRSAPSPTTSNRWSGSCATPIRWGERDGAGTCCAARCWPCSAGSPSRWFRARYVPFALVMVVLNFALVLVSVSIGGLQVELFPALRRDRAARVAARPPSTAC